MRLKQCIFALVAMLLCAFSANAQTTVATEADLKAALTAGGEVVLGADIQLAEALYTGVDDVALDLGGYDITAGSDGYVIYNTNGATLTIKDSNGSSVVTGVVYTGTGGKTVVNGGTYNAISKYVFLNAGGELVINEATLNGLDNYPLYSYNEGHKLEVNDIVVNGECGCLNAYGSNGTVEINGGEFNFSGREGKTFHIVYISTQTACTINGGTFRKVGDVDLNGEGGGGVCVNGGGVLNVIGGTFDGAINDIDNYSTGTTTITVSGGNFSDKSAQNYITTGSTVTMAGTTYTKTENGLEVAPAFVAKIGDVEYTSLQEALNAAAAGTGNVTVTILDDVNLAGVTWNPVTVSAPGYPVVTVEGGNHTITGLTDMLFAGTWAGGSGLIIKDLTIENSAIVNDKDDAKGTVGVGAFIGFPQASATITLENCHLKNSSVEGGHWTGGLIGYAAGYAGNDGPVFMNLTIKGCSVTGSTITGKGSAGGIIGHGSGNAWTNVVIEETTVQGNTITSTGSSANKAGAVMGTIGAAGQATTVNGVTKTGGIAVSATVADNTVTSNGTEITTIYGRQGTATGMLYVAGGSYDNYPIEEGVAYAAPAEGYEIVENADGTYGVERNLQVWDGVSINTAWYNTTDTEFTLNTADELAGFAAIANGTAEGIAADTFEGKTIKLGNNIDLNNQPWAPIGGRTSSTLSGQIECTFDGQGYTISNLKVEKGSAYEAVNMNIGLFGITRSGKFVARNFTLENVDVYGSASVAAVLGRTVNCKAVIENVTVKGLIKLEASTQNIAAICAQGYSPVINNCHVIGADGSYIKAGTVQVGGILGWSGESSKVTSITGCSIENVTISGEAYVGTIASILQYGATATNNNAKNVVLNVSDDEHHYGTIVGSVGAGYIANNGNATAPVTLNENITENVKVILNGTAVDSPIEYGAHYDGTTYLTARIGNDYYEDIDVAINAVQDSETITLIRDLTFTTGANGTTNGTSYTRGVNFTLDLNGKTITSDLGNNALRFKIGDGNDVAGKEVTINIKNGKLVSGANNWCAVSAATADNSNNKLIVNLTDLQIEANKAGDYAVKSWAGAVINTANVDITANYAGGFYAVGGEIVLDENSSVVQKGLHTAPYLSYAFGVSGNGKMTVNGGAYSAAPAAEADAYNQGASHGSFVGGVMSSGGTLIINGGTFSNDNFGDALPTAPRALLAADAGANIEINGGTFNAMAKIVDDTNNTGDASKNANVTIKGGTFSADPTVANWGLVNLADGYVALPDLAGNYVVGVKPTATVNNLGMTTVAAGDYSIWNGSFDQNTEDDGDMPLSFVMQFLADQTEEDMATSPYADWYGDFVLTFTGIENGSFTADGCYLAGHYGSFGWVKVPVDGMVIEDGARYPVMLSVGLGQKYDYICSSVEDFRCALYLTPEVLEANPNIQVNLELAVVDNSQGSDAAASALINNENVYSVTDYTYVADDFVVDPNYIEELTIDDAEGLDYTNDTDKTVGTLTYKRTLIEGIWNPLYLPFEVELTDELLAEYDFADYNQMISSDTNGDRVPDSFTMELFVYTSGTLEANYPYFVCPKTADACNLELILSDVTLYAAKEVSLVTSSVKNTFKLSGTYKAMDAASLAGCYAISTDGEWSLTEGLKPFRLYFTITDNNGALVTSTASKSIRIVVRGEDGFTGIEDVTGETNENVIFDIQGRRILEPQKGEMYIINGKKVIY